MKRMLGCLCALAVIGTAFAIEVDQDELKQAENTPIEFINYTGSHAEIDSLRAIADNGIGRSSTKRQSGRHEPLCGNPCGRYNRHNRT